MVRGNLAGLGVTGSRYLVMLLVGATIFIGIGCQCKIIFDNKASGFCYTYDRVLYQDHLTE